MNIFPIKSIQRRKIELTDLTKYKNCECAVNMVALSKYKPNLSR